MRVLCPACGLKCVIHFNADFAECPDHGKFSGALMYRSKHMAPWEAEMEIKFEQLASMIRRWFEAERWAALHGKPVWRYPYA